MNCIFSKLISFRQTFNYQSYVVKKYVPQTDAMKDVVNNLVSGGIILHEFQKYDFYRGKKEVKKHV